MLTKDVFATELQARLKRASMRGLESIEINAGELHRALGDYPGPNHQMPSCCKAMHDECRSDDEIIETPPSGYGASLTILYRLPR